MANRNRGLRMEKEWNEITSSFSDFTTDNQQLILGSVAPDTTATVLRMLGEYVITPTAGGTFVTGDECELVIGIGVVSTAAVTAGAASLPNPHTDADYPWLYRASHMFQMEDSAPTPAGHAVALRRPFDIRSMRKMKSAESLVAIGNYSNQSGLPPMSVLSGSTRVLFAGI